jgi:hypothetical protein
MDSISASIMVWSVLFGGIGIGYFIYGKQQKAIVPMCRCYLDIDTLFY